MPGARRPGLRVSAGGVSRQLRRLGGWLDPYYERVKLELRASPRVNGDETGWRTGGRNGYLWAVTDPKHTLYHVDQRRSGEVVEGLLGRAFPGTLTCDFNGAYNRLDCPKQRCLAHLLRELKDAARDSPGFAATTFYRRCRGLLKGMLALKRKWDELDDATYTRHLHPPRLPAGGPARSTGEGGVRRAERRAAGEAIAQAPRRPDAVPVGQGVGRHQQRRRAGVAPRGGDAQNHRR